MKIKSFLVAVMLVALVLSFCVPGFATQTPHSHQFLNGTCFICGYVCPHNHTIDEEYNFSPIVFNQSEYLGEAGHTSYYTTTWCRKCSDCNLVLQEIQNNLHYCTDPHYFVNGVCVSCGYKSQKSNAQTNKTTQSERMKLMEQNMRTGRNAIGKTAVVRFKATIFANANGHSNVRGSILVDQRVTVKDYQQYDSASAFYKINYNGMEGWISVGNVEIDSKSGSQGNTASTYKSSAACSHVGRWFISYYKTTNAHSGPGMSYSTISTVYPNETFQILDCKTDADGKHWFKIRNMGVDCWIIETRCTLR